MKVYWVSRHPLSPAQQQAIKDLHGDDVEVVHNPVSFTDETGLSEFIKAHQDGFVYAVAGGQHYIEAALAGCRFGIFSISPQRRADGVFGLEAVYYINHCRQFRVWVDPDPSGDAGDVLAPVSS